MSDCINNSNHYERGAALIIVLGLVAIISGWATTAAFEDMLSLRRAEHGMSAAKAEMASLSAFELVKMSLKQDARDGAVDNLDEDWAQTAPPFPIDDGLVEGEIKDANRYLNLNTLIDTHGHVVVAMVAVFKRLFTAHDLNPSLVDALVDWLDADDITFGPGGAEDSAYLYQPYKVKNAALDRWRELAMVEGFDAQTLKTLRPWVRVWPLMSGSKVNINTVSKEVLLAMFPLMSDVDVEDILAARPYTTLKTLATLAWAQGGEAQGMFSRLSVASDVFMLRTHAVFGHADWREEYGLLRQGEKVTLLWRERLFENIQSATAQVNP
ncbi:MAG: type II secretion system minor pseudopilin GspK [Mariprofundaceae bacterium]|nr:type II secretion system minor pseudopilin GspK [Mariprofundaceae bacterium]